MLLIVNILVAGAAFAPMQPPRADCSTEPLKLTWSDLLRTGDLGREIVRRHCLGREHRLAFRRPRALTVGQMTLGSFGLAGERIEFGFDLVLASENAIHGRLPGGRLNFRNDYDELYLFPTVRLPEHWQRVIDQTGEVALVVGSVGITTIVLIELLGAL